MNKLICIFTTLLAFSSHPIKTPGGFSLTSSLTDSYVIHQELHIFPVKVLQGRKFIQVAEVSDGLNMRFEMTFP